MMEQTLHDNIIKWASKHLGSSFSFREHQLEAIESIIRNVVEDIHPTHIIEAPTGSGKSLIFMISAGVLSEYYHMSSYILCSDLYLFSQYEDAIRINKLPFGHLKGQTGNYACMRTQEDVRNSECRIAKIPWSKLYNSSTANQLGYSCASYCEYLKDRMKAQKSDVTLMTYQLYFYMINVIRPGLDPKSAPFKQRDVIFCDECHNIPSLVQGQYSPTIREALIEKLIELYKYNIRYHDGLFAEDELPDLRKEWPTENVLKKAWEGIWNAISDERMSNEDNLSLFNEYADMIAKFGNTVEYIEEALAVKKRSTEKLSKDDIAMYKVASWYRNYGCFISDFRTAINDCGAEYVVKQITIKDDTEEKVVTFNCAKEDYMCYKYLLGTSEHQVLTSATVGMREAFEDNIGIKYMDEETKFEKIPSTFDFTQSPVIISSKWKMSYDNKDISFPHIRDMIYQIVRAFKGQRGMIQTGSYENAKSIVMNAPYDLRDRFQLYNNSQEKSWMIEMHKAMDESVIIGPTLVEGVDLPDDLLRFIIIAKVPYLNLKDKLVKAKMNLFPEWYDSETANSIIQGIGRGNRSEKDWCITYIIDGCFPYLFQKTRKQFVPELQNRFKYV